MSKYLISTVVLISTFVSWLSVVSGELQSRAVEEGKCFQPHLASFINPFWFLSPRKYFIPLASEYSYLNYAEVFLGRSVADWSELERMCLLVEISGLSALTRGFGKTLGQSCNLTPYVMWAFSPGQLQCHVTRDSPGMNATLFDEYIDNVVLTDNMSYALYVRCVNGIRDYKVISVHRVLPDRVKNEVTHKIVKLGFDPKLIRTLACNRNVRVPLHYD